MSVFLPSLDHTWFVSLIEQGTYLPSQDLVKISMVVVGNGHDLANRMELVVSAMLWFKDETPFYCNRRTIRRIYGLSIRIGRDIPDRSSLAQLVPKPANQYHHS